MDEFDKTSPAAQEVCLHDNRATLGMAAGALLLAALSAGLIGAQDSDLRALLALSLLLGAVGGTFGFIALRHPRRVTLSARGLTIRSRAGCYILPAAAIEGVGVEAVGRLRLITLWYDVQQVPALDPALAFYARSQAPCGNGKIYIGVASDHPGTSSSPLSPSGSVDLQAVSRIVAEGNLGQWRDYPATS
jgi:hypothetical protein